MNLVVHCELRTLSEVLATAFIATLKGLFVGVDVLMLSEVLSSWETLLTVAADKVPDVEMLRIDVPLQVKFGVITSRTVRVKTSELIVIHYTSHLSGR